MCSSDLINLQNSNFSLIIIISGARKPHVRDTIGPEWQMRYGYGRKNKLCGWVLSPFFVRSVTPKTIQQEREFVKMRKCHGMWQDCRDDI